MLTGNQASAEDLLQTALVKTWPHWERVAREHPDAYVRRVMIRTNLTWRARLWNREVPNAAPAEDVLGAVSTRDEYRTVDERIVMAAALAALPVRQRQAVVLRYFDDLSVEETAEIMATSTGTVKSQSAKGLYKLREALNAETAYEQRDSR